jgi:hypothetical protein
MAKAVTFRLPTAETRFGPSQVHLGFVVDKMHSLEVLWFPAVISTHHHSTPILSSNTTLYKLRDSQFH